MNFNFSYSTNNEMDDKNTKVESFQIWIETQWNTLKESEWVFLSLTTHSFS